MDFSLSEEQLMLRDGAQRYLENNYRFEQRREILQLDSRCSAAHWSAFAEMGWLALPLPEDCGGLGGSMVDVALIMEAMGRQLVVEPYATTVLLAARLLGHRAASEPCATLLAKIAAGEARVAVATIEANAPRAEEPSAGAASLARAVAVGAAWKLSGAKVLVYDAPAAQQLIVSARVGTGDEVGLWLVPASAPGIGLQSYPLIDGTLAADVSFRDVALPATALLLRGAAAEAALDEATDRLVLARVAEALGAMEAVLQLTAEYLRNRSQFGQPLARFQALQHRMAEMFVEVQETRSILYYGLAKIEAPAAERRAAVSAAKIVAIQAGRIVGGQGIQLHGGIGMTDEYSIGHFFKRLIAIEKSFGDLDTHLTRFAETYQH